MQTAILSRITRHGARAIEPDASSLVMGDDRASAEQRISVYAHMYRARIAEALAAQFPRLAKELGADDFAALSAAYVAEQPSVHWSLRYVGERFPDWLELDDPILAALARLEWARADVFDLVDEPLLGLEDLRTWPADRFAELPLKLVAAHRLVNVPSGTGQLWESIGSGKPDDSPSNPASTASESLLVWRQGIAVYHRSVDEFERAALELAAKGTRFGVVCESLAGSLDEETTVARAFAWLSTWVLDELVVATDA